MEVEGEDEDVADESMEDDEEEEEEDDDTPESTK